MINNNNNIKRKLFMSKNFGLPYVGSKSRIAPWLMEMLPDCEHFVDIFAGGCAVSHAMILHGKAKMITINDIQGDVSALFIDALHGDLQKYDPYHWISREEFFAKKDNNPFIRLVYSFGNNGKSYLYNREIEEYKKSVHFALVNDEWSSFDILCPELSEKCKNELLKYPIDNKDYYNSIKIRRLNFQRKCTEILCDISNNNWYSDVIQQNPFYRTAKKEWISHCKSGNKVVGMSVNEEILNTLRIDGISYSSSVESIERIESINNSNNNFPIINSKSMDYRLLDIPNNSVVFCDPPYKNSTVKYNNIKFSHKEFYDWCLEKAKHNDVYVTEYNIEHPNFQLVGEKGRKVSMNDKGSKGIKVERLYKVVP